MTIRAKVYFLDVSEIVDKVKAGGDRPFRPLLPSSSLVELPELAPLLKHCWVEEPRERTPFDELAKILKRLDNGGGWANPFFAGVAIWIIFETASVIEKVD